MSRSIDLYKVNKDVLINKTMEVHNTNDKAKVIEVLDYFGTTIGEDYILLNNEYYEEHNPYYHLIDVMNRLFPINKTEKNKYPCWQTDVFFKVREELSGIYHDSCEIFEKFGIDIEEESK